MPNNIKTELIDLETISVLKTNFDGFSSVRYFNFIISFPYFVQLCVKRKFFATKSVKKSGNAAFSTKNKELSKKLGDRGYKRLSKESLVFIKEVQQQNLKRLLLRERGLNVIT